MPIAASWAVSNVSPTAMLAKQASRAEVASSPAKRIEESSNKEVSPIALKRSSRAVSRYGVGVLAPAGGASAGRLTRRSGLNGTAFGSSVSRLLTAKSGAAAAGNATATAGVDGLELGVVRMGTIVGTDDV